MKKIEELQSAVKESQNKLDELTKLQAVKESYEVEVKRLEKAKTSFSAVSLQFTFEDGVSVRDMDEYKKDPVSIKLNEEPFNGDKSSILGLIESRLAYLNEQIESMDQALN